jgi:hypothetical protein
MPSPARRQQASRGEPAWVLTALATSLVLGFAAAFARPGADCYWVAALGREVLRTGRVPDGIPFAAAATAGWPNVTVAAEVLFAWLAQLGAGGLVGAQLLADTAALLLLALGARRLGGSDAGTAAVLVLVAAGSLPALVVVRLQLLSLIPFALLLLLLRREHERPSWRVWLLVPLVAAWSNLHGAVLMGVAVAGAYLLLSRARRDPRTALAVVVASLLALSATPAGLRTGSYYLGVLGNEAARRGTGLWARPSPHNVFDILLVGVALVLLLLALRRRLPLWEYAALAGVSVATLTSARHGIWLLFLCAAPAAARVGRRLPAAPWGRPAWAAAISLAGVAAACLLVVGRGESLLPSDPRVVSAVVRVAGDGVVLAEEPLVESLAFNGVRVWVSNPIDAFRPRDQAAYLDFLAAGPDATVAVSNVDVVVVQAQSPAAALVGRDPGLAPVQSVDGWVIYRRSR